MMRRGLPGGASSKELPANAGDVRDVGLIPRSGRSPGAGHGNPLQCSCWRIPWTESLEGYSPQGCRESDTTEVTLQSTQDSVKSMSWTQQGGTWPGLLGGMLSISSDKDALLLTPDTGRAPLTWCSDLLQEGKGRRPESLPCTYCLLTLHQLKTLKMLVWGWHAQNSISHDVKQRTQYLATIPTLPLTSIVIYWLHLFFIHNFPWLIISHDTATSTLLAPLDLFVNRSILVRTLG